MSEGILKSPLPYRDGFGKMIVTSVILHLVTILFAVVVFKGKVERKFITPTYTVEIISPAASSTQKKKIEPKEQEKIPTPIKKKTKKKTKAKEKVVVKAPAKKKKKTKAKKIKKKTKKAIVVPPKEKEVSIEDALIRIKASLEAKEKEEKAEKLVEARLKNIEKKVTASERKNKKITSEIATIEDAVIKKGASITREAFKHKLSAYHAEIVTLIRSRWNQPTQVDTTNLDAIFSIVISKRGMLVSMETEERSGNILFDESTQRAIKKSAPFPPLPKEMEGNFLELGIKF
ncbi:MAG: TonB C-terminal domain-containing protein [Deltaproteobacteria bacterium]|nr:TonB C-terminal domain-containing protein [Deltaproteobacteria bacterium]